MDYNTLYNTLLDTFSLRELPPEDQEEMLLEVTKTIQKQFLYDVFDVLGREKFDALQKSAEMGESFYMTTLKHLVPNHQDLYMKALEKVALKFKQE